MVNNKKEKGDNANTSSDKTKNVTTIDVDIFLIKTVQEFMFFFSIMFILYYVKRKVGKITKEKRDIEYYMIIGLIVLNIIVNTIKIIIFLKKIITNNCNFLNGDATVTIPGGNEFGGEVGVNKG